MHIVHDCTDDNVPLSYFMHGQFTKVQNYKDIYYFKILELIIIFQQQYQQFHRISKQ